MLDLFAGSGAMGLEALSRGAGARVFVEADRRAAETIDANLEKLRLTGARIVRDDAVRALAAEASAGRKYDLVLVDPRTTSTRPRADARALSPARSSPTDGLLVVETGARVEPQLPLEHAHVRSYGSARMTLFDMITAICPGSYDPVTNGHVDVIGRAAAIFDRVVVGVVGDAAPQDSRLFTLEERVEFLARGARRPDNVEVDVFSELVVDFARKWEAKAIVKGLRVISDFEWEFQMNQLNRTLAPGDRDRLRDGEPAGVASSPRAA